MDYNSTREKLKLPEYGRNVQNMVNHMLSIKDRDERTRCAYAIVSVMGNMFPHLRDISDFDQKLWDHLTIMSDFKLDIESPCPLPTEESIHITHEKLPYSDQHIKIKHYGINVEKMINLAAEMTDKKEKDQLVYLIANHMKKLFLQWNKDVVNDAKIFDDLHLLSQKRLEYSEKDFKLIDPKIVVTRVKKRRNPNKNDKR
jgi:hypothetical protein